MAETRHLIRNVVIAGACAIVSALRFGGIACAEPTFVVDQSQTAVDLFFNLRFSGVTGQEFVPALSSLRAVELLFDGPDGSFPPDLRGDFSTGIREGSPTGPESRRACPSLC